MSIIILFILAMPVGGTDLARHRSAAPEPVVPARGHAGVHQADTVFVLMGRVHGPSGHPIAGAAVFLNHTTYGDGTDDDGRFTVEAPAGVYELIVSHIGYEPLLQTVHLDAATSGAVHALDVVLVPRTHELEEVTVRALPDPTRKRRLRQFTRDLLGAHSIDRKAVLRNPEAVGFTSTADGFKAWFLAPLRIENPYTGYRIEVYMARYERARDFFKTRYFVRFGELAACTPVLEEHRRRAYKGTFQHFIDSWLQGVLRKEGFTAQRWFSGEPVPDLPPEAVAVIPPFQDRIVIDYAGRADMRFEDYLIQLFGSRKLRKRGHALYPMLTQRSFLTFRGMVKISPNGALVGPIRKEGYWGFRGLGGAVPSTFSASRACEEAPENIEPSLVVDKTR